MAASAAPTSAAGQILVMLPLPVPHYRPDTTYTGSYDDLLGRSFNRRVAAEIAKKYGLRIVDDWPMALLNVDCYIFSSEADADPDLMQLLADDKRVQWAQPLNEFHALSATESLRRIQPTNQLWHLSSLHAIATGKGETVAIIDSRVDDTHPDLVGQLAVKEDFVTNANGPYEAHGTEVAGIIGARADERARILGVAPDAKLMALRACWQKDIDTTVCSSFTLAKALEFALEHHADVINMSLSGPYDPLVQRFVTLAISRGTSVVAAMDPTSTDGGFPASQAGVVPVSDASLVHAQHRFFVAPGDDILTDAPFAQWTFVSGSSFSAAHVSGLIALLREASAAQGGSRQTLLWGADDGLAKTVDPFQSLQHASSH
jgi:subtilisin family serine protease